MKTHKGIKVIDLFVKCLMWKGGDDWKRCAGSKSDDRRARGEGGRRREGREN